MGVVWTTMKGTYTKNANKKGDTPIPSRRDGGDFLGPASSIVERGVGEVALRPYGW